jgi:hypothetical protein
MTFACTIRQLGENSWLIQHASPAIGSVKLMATTREQALEKMRSELRYRLELCPCSGETYQHVQIALIPDVERKVP